MMERATEMMNYLKLKERLNKSHGTDINISKEYLLRKNDDFGKQLQEGGFGFSIAPGFQYLGAIGAQAEKLSGIKKSERLVKISTSSLNAIMSAGQRMTVQELVKGLNIKHNGNYFICRVITLPYNLVSLDMVADVPSPDDDLAVRVALYNFTDQKSKLGKFIPKGTKLLVLHPYLKLTKDGGLSLISYEKNEIFAIDEELLNSKFSDLKWPALTGEPVKPKPSPKKSSGAIPKVDFKVAGNKCYKKGKYDEAIEHYSRALDTKPRKPDAEDILLSNRAAAYLKVGKYHLALADAENVLSINPNHVKANYRRAKALVALGKYDVAIKILETEMPLWSAAEVTESRGLLEEAKKLQLEKKGKDDKV